MDILEKAAHAVDTIRNRIDIQPELGLILGSGLGELAQSVQDPTFIDYSDIPHFPVSTVKGHAGRLVIGTVEDKPVLVMQGRFHYYEGFSMNQVAFPVRCMKVLGIDNLIVTNAAGSLDPDLPPGQLMLIRDHIKMVSDSPLRGPNIDEFGSRFNDMSDPYNGAIRQLASDCAEELGISVKEGVYCYWPGPSYETASEIRMLRLLGGDVVGMSTVPEVITASHAGMKILGISCVTNPGTGLFDRPLSHEDIIAAGERVRETFIRLLRRIVAKWPIE